MTFSIKPHDDEFLDPSNAVTQTYCLSGEAKIHGIAIIIENTVLHD